MLNLFIILIPFTPVCFSFCIPLFLFLYLYMLVSLYPSMYLSLYPSMFLDAVALSTWKCGLETQRASCWNKGFIIFLNSCGSITSRISSSSFRNMTCNVLLIDSYTTYIADWVLTQKSYITCTYIVNSCVAKQVILLDLQFTNVYLYHGFWDFTGISVIYKVLNLAIWLVTFEQRSPTFCGRWAKKWKNYKPILLGAFNSYFFAICPKHFLWPFFLFAPYNLKRATFGPRAIGWRPLL